MLSYSTIQRKTRTLNQLLGTKYSANKIMKAQAFAEKHGFEANEYRMIRNLPTTRADVKHTQAEQWTESEFYAEEFLKFQYGGLAYASKWASQILNANTGDFFDEKGAILHKVGDSYTRTKIDGTTETITADKVGKLRPVTARTKQQTLAHYAEKMHKLNKETTGHGYEKMDEDLVKYK